jgi:sugar (pentulose or hexulose) kinase
MQARRRLPNILVLSIDIGTSSTRSALFDENANAEKDRASAGEAVIEC